MRYVFVFLFALVLSCGVPPFADCQASPPENGKLEKISPQIDSEPTLSSPQEMRSVIVNDTTTPINEEPKPMKRATEERTCPPASSQMVELTWFTTTNADHACGGQLVISNMPLGAWLEIDGNFYRHQDKSGMRHVVVDGFAEFTAPKSIRTGRNPYSINSSDAKTATVQLLGDQAVYLDWTREFRSLDYRGDKSDRFFSQASMIAVARPISSMPVATVPTLVAQTADEELEIVSSVEAGKFLSLEVARLSDYAISNPTADASIRLLRISGELKRLKALTQKCFLKGPVEIKFTNAAGQESTLELQTFQLELNLAIGSVEAGKESLVANLLAARFVEDIKKEKNFVSLIRNAAPIDGEETTVALRFSGPNQIGFNNQILEEDVSFETGNSIAEDITIGVKVKLAAANPTPAPNP